MKRLLGCIIEIVQFGIYGALPIFGTSLVSCMGWACQDISAPAASVLTVLLPNNIAEVY